MPIHRKVLEGYTFRFRPVDQHSLGMTIITYSLYTFFCTNLPGNHAMMLTIPL
jgi:hypothetical protein